MGIGHVWILELHFHSEFPATRQCPPAHQSVPGASVRTHACRWLFSVTPKNAVSNRISAASHCLCLIGCGLPNQWLLDGARVGALGLDLTRL